MWVIHNKIRCDREHFYSPILPTLEGIHFIKNRFEGRSGCHLTDIFHSFLAHMIPLRFLNIEIIDN